MPWRNQNFWEWLYDILVNYGTVIYGFILAVAISIFSTAKKYGKVDWLEAIICGLLVLAFSSVLDWLGWPQSVSLVIAGIVGFKGTIWVDQKFTKFWNSKFEDKDN